MSTTTASKRERGSVTVITAGILAVVGTITFAVVKLGVAANERARAQAIADLGSLAGASTDLDTAKRVVARNGATVLQATESGEAVDLSVSLGDAQAEARAERLYVPWNPIDSGPGVTDDIETTTIATTAAPTTTRALIFAPIATTRPPTPTPTTRALIFAPIAPVTTKPASPPPVTTKKPMATVSPKLAPAPGTSPRRR